METESGDVGIPPLIDPEGRWWERTWDVTFATAVDAGAISQSATELTDPWIEVVARSTGTAEAAITIRSEKTVDYVDFWDNGFRVLMLLSRRLAFIEKIEGRERNYWRRFFSHADREATLERYKTPLMLAAKNGDLGAIVQGLEAANDLEERSFSGKTALLYAAESGCSDVVEFLLKEGAGLNHVEPEWTPLQLAASSSSAEVVRLFLNSGGEVNAQNYYGETPLMWAAVRGATDVVELLLRRGARMDLKDTSGSTVHEWASKLVHSVTTRDRYEPVVRLLNNFRFDDVER
jgi:hypothetical protein